MNQKERSGYGSFVDEVFEFPGIWEIPSKCGLKIVRKADVTIVLITDLYDENPGTSVTSHCAALVNYISKEKKLDAEKAFFIQHNPDLGSKYEFLNETFDKVSFLIHDGVFSNPKWERIARQHVEELLEL